MANHGLGTSSGDPRLVVQHGHHPDAVRAASSDLRLEHIGASLPSLACRGFRPGAQRLDRRDAGARIAFLSAIWGLGLDRDELPDGLCHRPAQIALPR